MRRGLSLGFLCIAALGLVTPALARPKKDIVVLTNGDRLTGEIKSMDRGKLRFKTESLATVEIEWDTIQTIRSTEVFQLETTDGTNFIRIAEEGSTQSTIRVVSDQAADEIELANIVRVRSVEEGFWNRLDGSLSSGFNYTQSSAVATFTFDADVRSRTPRVQLASDRHDPAIHIHHRLHHVAELTLGDARKLGAQHRFPYNAKQ